MALRTAIMTKQKAREKKKLEEIKRTARKFHFESLPNDKQMVVASGLSNGSAPTIVQGRTRVRSPFLITPETPDILDANKSQQEKPDRDSLRTAKEKAGEKKKLDEMERNEGEDLMVPPLRFTQVQNSWLLVPPTQPPLLPLKPLKEPPPLIELPSHSNPTPSFVKVRSKRNLARYSFYVT